MCHEDASRASARECMQGFLNVIPDGPWRVADTFDLIFEAEALGEAAFAAAVRLAARLVEAALPVSRFVLAGGSDLDRLQSWPFDFALEAVANVGAAMQALDTRRGDILLVEGTLDLAAAAIWEMIHVAGTDPMIAGVSPRFSPVMSGGSSARNGPEEAPGARRSLQTLGSLLPPTSYVPLPDPRCLYLKGSVLAQVPPDLRTGRIDWDDYALSINRYGFRMAVANRACVETGPGGDPVSAAALMARAAQLESRHPGTRKAVQSFVTGAPRAAERLLAGLAPNGTATRDIAFDLTHLGPSHSGTAELARALIRRAATGWSGNWDVYVVASAETYEFHFGDAPERPKRIEPDEPRVFACFVRIGQPFSWKEVDHAVRRAPVLVFFMLDTIGLDCIRLAPDELDALWRFTLAEADGLLFNSAFTMRQFERRFTLPDGIPKLASLHSLRLDEHGPTSPVGTEGTSVLVLGNRFEHKYVAEAARIIAAADAPHRVVALGPKPGSVPGVICHASGSLDPAAMSNLYRDAGVVVYPTLYEGFGFPLLEALAHRRPVLVRRLEPFDEIRSRLAEAANVHVFEDDADLVRRLATPLTWIDRPGEAPGRGWSQCADDLLDVVEAALRRADYGRVLRRVDFMRGRMEWARRKRFRTAELADEAGSDPADRLAGLAGRMGQDVVLQLGRMRAASMLLRLADRMTRRARKR